MTGSVGAFGRIDGQIVLDRRELHRIAEPGWCEVFTASKIVGALQSLGFTVRTGSEVIAADGRLGLPSREQLDFFFDRALRLGAPPETAERFRDGFTGVVGSLKCAAGGPVVAFRFDIDANYGDELQCGDHRPAREGFASSHAGTHHNCGHDGHTALGLSLARFCAARACDLVGELRLIFQPAEEGLRGASAMVAAGVLDDVDYFVGCHLGVQARQVGEIVSGYRDILGSIKIDAVFSGEGAHAAISPHCGKNALMAACVASQNLMAIPRHGAGDTRINVGRIVGGESRNTVPSQARVEFEIRSDTPEALEYLRETADRILSAAADMHGVTHRLDVVGRASAASSDPGLAQLVRRAAEEMPSVHTIRDGIAFKGSDDATEMMRCVQQQGGQAVYFGIGTSLNAVHHNPGFDFDETALPLGAELLQRVALRLLAEGAQKNR